VDFLFRRCLHRDCEGNKALTEKFDQSSAALQKAGFLPSILGKLLLFFATLSAGCATNRESATSPFFPSGTLSGRDGEYGDQISYWSDARSRGKPWIVVDLEKQRAYFYKGGRIVGISVVSTGREGYDTPSGDFRITEKDPTHVSSTYGDYVDQNGDVVMKNVDITKDPRPRGTVFRGAPMPYFLRIHGPIGMHAGYLPGYPASHGCIRLPEEMAGHFFHKAPIGTPVAIHQGSPPGYGSDSLIGDTSLPLTSIMQR
jgi:lipoprotein-anchoring transpeptidase ErfK/SrfK